MLNKHKSIENYLKLISIPRGVKNDKVKAIYKRVLLLIVFLVQTGFINYYRDPVFEARKIIEKRSFYQNSKIELQKKAIKGMIQDFDDFSDFLDTEDFNALQESVSGEFVGVGLEVFKKPSDKFVKIISPISGSPAEKAGLKAGDKIFIVGGHDVSNKNLTDVVNLIKGKEGTEVEMTVEQNGKLKIFKIMRAKIKTQSVLTEVHDDIFVIVIRSFMQNTFDEFKIALQKYSLEEKKYNYIVFDLRNNPGGLLDVVVNMSNLFLHKGDKITTIKAKNDVILSEYISDNENPVVLRNMVMLVNKGSASASEIFVASLQENKKGILIGETTFGKGSVQEVIPMQTLKDTAIKLTIAKYYTPTGKCVDKVGVEPDKKINIKNYSEIKDILKNN